MKSHLIRKNFIEFFKNKEHQIVNSAPIVLKDDPTLMFTNSGMNQFKDFFLGYKTPTSSRIADTQKCLRVSGKHNDLDDVGRDTYHHTMFEMLGNWSFGDYFKEEAIAWSWELLTDVFNIPKEYLYVTIFEGDKEDGTVKDTEAYELWKKHTSEDRILLGDKKDNFWEMGATGPCGPCSEIHIDIRPKEEKEKVDGKELVNMDHPQVIEIWNLVFMQFLRKADGSLDELPEKSIDTGMGFERLCMVLQDKISNYDTDVFTPLISHIEKLSGKSYGKTEELDMAIRVVVDHIRAVAFAIADGQLPSNNGAGYVIKRILRRAISYGYRFLDFKEPFMFTLVEVLEKQMGEFFPELSAQKGIIEGVIKEEEQTFLRTIGQGLDRISQIIETQDKSEKEISGAKIFELYDTFGFPLDLSRIIVEESGFSVDEKGFELEMQKQKQRSKGAAETKMEDWVVLDETPEAFIGYDQISSQVKITRYRKVNVKKGHYFQVALDQTPFYAESGGQVGDKGFLTDGNQKWTVKNTVKENNLIVHILDELPENTEGSFTATIDVTKRTLTTKNHTATHLLHEALRTVLGEHVEQKGSYVDEKYLRFDFSHFSKVTDEQIIEVENLVNEKIQAGIPLDERRSIAFQEAVDAGAMALFGEKYGDHVRMIKFDSSVELCGGTHVENTSEISLFKITSESSVASGIRRIEAITFNKAIETYKKSEQTLKEALALLKNPKDIIKTIESLQKETSTLKKQVESFVAKQSVQEKAQWISSLEQKNGIKFFATKTELDSAAVKSILFSITKEFDNAFLVVVSTANGKPTISVAISKPLVEQNSYDAGKIVRELAKEIKGGGGGQAFFATAGGKDINGVNNILQKAESFL